MNSEMIRSEERLLNKEYWGLFSEYPPKFAFGLGMSDKEWLNLVRSAVMTETRITAKSIKQLHGKPIIPEGAYTDDEYEAMQDKVNG